MARLSLSKPCKVPPLRLLRRTRPRQAARYSPPDQEDMPPQETSAAGSGRSDRIPGLNIHGVYLFRKIQSLKVRASRGYASPFPAWSRVWRRAPLASMVEEWRRRYSEHEPR